MNFVDQCGALESSDKFLFTLADIKRLDSLIRADQRATDASIAHNFPFSPSIGQAIEEIIRCWRDDRAPVQTQRKVEMQIMQNPVEVQTR